MQQQRVRRSASDWRSVLSDFESSGLSAVAYCRKHHIGTKGFYRARSLYSKGGNGKSFVQAVASPAAQPASSLIAGNRVRLD